MAQAILLAISTSAKPEVAIASTDRTIATGADGQALESLLPAIVRALGGFGATLDDVSLIGVCTGPGSFTGLRIGVTFAKTLAQSGLRRIVGVSAYDVAAFGRNDAQFPRAAIVAGKRDFFYARIVRSRGSDPQFAIGSADEIRPVLERACVRPTDVARIADDSAPGERARRVARIALRRFAEGAAGGWGDVAIDYGQRPNAVVNWEARRGRG